MACRLAERWMFRLSRSYSWPSPYRVDRDYAFQDKKGKTRLIITTDGLITVTRGYAWDGCTPKTCFLDVVFGTPDGVVSKLTGLPKTYHASLIHDALCQFLPEGLPLTRAQADRCFLILMEQTEFRLRWLYYGAVCAFGWFTKPLTRKIRDTDGGHRIDMTDEAPRPAA